MIEMLVFFKNYGLLQFRRELRKLCFKAPLLIVCKEGMEDGSVFCFDERGVVSFGVEREDEVEGGEEYDAPTDSLNAAPGKES